MERSRSEQNDSERLRGERERLNQVFDHIFERWQVVGLRKARRR